MKIHSIDYKKHFWNDWAVYTQAIKIDKELMKKYNNRINYLKIKINKKIEKNHTFTYDDWKILSFTKSLKKWINYLKITWLYEFWKILKKYKIDDKRILNRNTIIEVL